MNEIVRRWAPVLPIVAVPVVAQRVLLDGRYDVSGHAAEHLASASVPFVASAMIGLLLLLTARARRQPFVLAAAGAWLTATVVVLVGNVRVVDALIAGGMADTPTSRFVQTPSTEAAHGLADAAPLLGMAAAVLLALALWRGHHVSGRVAIGATAASLLFPPWIIPGAGVVVLVVARGLTRRRELRELRGLREPRVVAMDVMPRTGRAGFDPCPAADRDADCGLQVSGD